MNQDNEKKKGVPGGRLMWLKTLLPRMKDGGKQGEKPNGKPNGKPKLTKETKRELKRTITTVEYNSSNSDKKEETTAAIFQVELTPQLAIANIAPHLAYPDLWQRGWYVKAARCQAVFQRDAFSTGSSFCVGGIRDTGSECDDSNCC